MILDETVEFLREKGDPHKLSGRTRKLGLTVVRGSTILSILAEDGYEELENPYAKPEES